MMFRQTLLVCLPLLAFAACKADSKKSNSPVNPTAVADSIKGNNSGLETKGGSTPVVEQPTEGTVTPPTEGENKGGESNQNQNQNGSGQHECETLVIDFDNGPKGKLHAGNALIDQYKDWHVEFLAHKNLDNGSTLDNAKPDLIQTPMTGLGATTDLRQNARGGYVKLLFGKPTAIVSADFVDVDNNTSNVELFTMNGQGEYVSKSVQPIPQRADKETANLSIDDHSYIRKMTIKFTGSSAVDNIKICVKN